MDGPVDPLDICPICRRRSEWENRDMKSCCVTCGYARGMLGFSGDTGCTGEDKCVVKNLLEPYSPDSE
jgi:hypothetical protein